MCLLSNRGVIFGIYIIKFEGSTAFDRGIKTTMKCVPWALSPQDSASPLGTLNKHIVSYMYPPKKHVHICPPFDISSHMLGKVGGG